MSAIGIHDIHAATAHHVLDLDLLAAHRDVDPAKYRLGLGQDRMSVPAPDEDAVTMGASAAAALLRRTGTDGIRALLFATESGVDQSKAAGVYAHRLLGLPPQVRTAELKQACYGGTAALQTAIGLVARNPDDRVLVIASDVARYALDSPGEPTQGAGAVAMLVSADPALVEIEPVSGLSTADVDDFWRPNDRDVPVVDGRLSVDAYLDALTSAWDDFRARGGADVSRIDRFVHHQPYTKMARKAHARLAEHTGAGIGADLIEDGLADNRQIGNSYTASLYLGLCSLLRRDDSLAGKRIGLFSYGSGSVSEFFTGVVRPGYADAMRAAGGMDLDARAPLDLDAYRALHASSGARSDDAETPRVTTAPFRFAGVRGRARVYEATA
ncbi:hydroxymethylglutaryl-CoA synthase [Microbacterium indicum]|uniref:hydroxymethylglutaryl-CoA synthase n=1 Tax=Microbacterium indicum TaxID=358100 RepID=UPI0003FE9465|nr:hydroxymethylglutaryl-CoA synthase [Microbacterium indicum]